MNAVTVTELPAHAAEQAIREHFTHCATKEEAAEVFQDAEELHEWLTKRATEQVPA